MLDKKHINGSVSFMQEVTMFYRSAFYVHAAHFQWCTLNFNKSDVVLVLLK